MYVNIILSGRVMNFNLRTSLVCGTLAALSACGGSTIGGNFAQVGDLSVAVLTDVSELDFTPNEDVPITGTATYAGIAVLEEANPSSDEIAFYAIGHSIVTVDFAAKGLTGTVGNFYEVDFSSVIVGEGSTAYIDSLAAIDSSDATAVSGSLAMSGNIGLIGEGAGVLG